MGTSDTEKYKTSCLCFETPEDFVILSYKT